jgi:chromatin remodeling complex protein RSC6
MPAAAKNALQRPLAPSPELAAVIGSGLVSRADATSRIWGYIRTHGCQNPKNKREIVADEKLRALFSGAEKVTMFELSGHIGRHLSKTVG